jgi:glutathione S-transferase
MFHVQLMIIMISILGFPSADEKVIQDLWNKLNDTLQRVDEILSGRVYLAGAQFTLVDVWSMPWMSQLIDLKGESLIFCDRPNLCDWWKRVSSRPAWLEALKLMNGAFEVLKRDEDK